MINFSVQWHRFFMILTWLMTLAGFIVIFVQLGRWSDETIHASLGLATTILCFIQPFMAALRPHPGAPLRSVFNWAHWFVGNAAHICGSESYYYYYFFIIKSATKAILLEIFLPYTIILCFFTFFNSSH